MKNEIIYYAENEAEAVVMIEKFKEFGIPCVQMQESYGARNGFNFGIFGEIALAVPEDRIAEAEAILLSLEDDEDELEEGERVETPSEKDEE